MVFEAHLPDELHLLRVAERFGHVHAGFLLEETKLPFLVCTKCTPSRNVGVKVSASSGQL